MCLQHRYCSYRGFTQVELMVSLAIAAIILTIGIPSFTTMIRNNQMTANVNEFLTTLNYVRTEAIKRGRPVSLCTSTDSTSCTNSNWNAGYVSFVDTNKNGMLDAGEERIRAKDTLGNVLTISSAVFTRAITFTASATLEGTSGLFTFCDDRGAAFAKAILVNLTGRPQTSSKDSNGGALTCP